MASDVDICNMALSDIGADAVVTSIAPPDGTAEAGHCARFYGQARRELLEYQQWSFSKQRVALAPVTNPSTIWQYAYATPSGMINALRVLQLGYLTDLGLYAPTGSYLNYYADWTLIDALFTERGSSDFEIEMTSTGQEILLTNEPNAVLLFTQDVTDTTKFSPQFVACFHMLLASYLAGPIIKGLQGAQVGAQWRKAAFDNSGRAAESNANSSNERAEHLASHLRVRS